MSMTYSGSLTILKCWCGLRHAVPRELCEHQLKQHHDGLSPDGIYCPLGHSHIPSGVRRVDELNDQLRRVQDEAERLNSRLSRERHSHRSTKGHLTRARRRSAAGTCPCCKRTFKQVRDHMKRRHPDYVKEQKCAGTW